MSKKPHKIDRFFIRTAVFIGLYAIFRIAKASYQNDNLTTAASPNKPVRQQAAHIEISPYFTAFITKVQKFLKAKGYNVATTGSWNTQTDKAQRAYMLKNGIFDSANFRKLVEGWREPINLINLSRKKK